MLTAKQKNLTLSLGAIAIGTLTMLSGAVEGVRGRVFTGMAVAGVGVYVLNDESLVDNENLDEELSAIANHLLEQVENGSAWLGGKLVKTKPVQTIIEIPRTITFDCFASASLALKKEAEWIDEFMDAPHHMIVARSGGGKTFIACAIIARTTQRYRGNIILLIGDTNFGKPTGPKGDGPPNDWMGYDSRMVAKTPEEIALIVGQMMNGEEVAGEPNTFDGLKARMKKFKDATEKGLPAPKFPKLHLVIDEWNSTYPECMKNDMKFIQNLEDILNQGRAYKVGITLIGQHCTSGQVGFSLSMMKQLCILVVGRDAKNSSVLRYLETEDIEAIISKANQIETVVKKNPEIGYGPCVVSFASRDAEAKVMPRLANNYRFPPSDPVAEWWEIASQDQEIIAYAAQEVQAYVNKERMTSPRDEIVAKFDRTCPKNIRVDNKNPYYARFVKPFIEELIKACEENFGTIDTEAIEVDKDPEESKKQTHDIEVEI